MSPGLIFIPVRKSWQSLHVIFRVFWPGTGSRPRPRYAEGTVRRCFPRVSYSRVISVERSRSVHCGGVVTRPRGSPPTPRPLQMEAAGGLRWGWRGRAGLERRSCPAAQSQELNTAQLRIAVNCNAPWAQTRTVLRVDVTRGRRRDPRLVWGR